MVCHHYLLLWNLSCTIILDLEEVEAPVCVEAELRRKYRKVSTSTHVMIITISKLSVSMIL